MSTANDSPSSRLVTLPTGIPRLTLGWEAIGWAAKYLRQPNGPAAGQRWRPTDSQARFLLWWYAVHDDGRWLFHHSARRLAKGAGKSPFAGVVSLIEFCAPVRVHDLDVDRGVVVGKPVSMPLVQIAATAESQTANTMRMVRAMAQKGSRVVTEHDLDPGKTKFYKAAGGELEIITSSASAAEGAEVTFAVADETEHWLPTNGGPALSEVLDRNLAKSGSRMMETSNAWEPGVGSVAEGTFDAWVAQEEGRLRGRSRILYDARIAPPDTVLGDEASLTAALEFVYDDCWWVDLQPLIERIWSPKTPEDVSRRFYLNQPTASFDSWLTPQDWQVLADPDVVVEPGDQIALFFDGSKTTDATALVGCRLTDGHVFLVGAWERPDGPAGDGWEVSSTDVDRIVEFAFTTWDVVGFFADVREWEDHTKTTWPERYGDRLTVWANSSGKEPAPIAWDMRSRTFEFTSAVEMTHTEIIEGKLTHDGHPVLERHVVNARRRPNRWGVSIGKESRHSPKKVDAAVCMVGARMVRRLALAELAKQKPKRSGKVW